MVFSLVSQSVLTEAITNDDSQQFLVTNRYGCCRNIKADQAKSEQFYLTN